METRIIILFFIGIAFFCTTLRFLPARYALPLFFLGTLFGLYVNLWLQIILFIIIYLYLFNRTRAGNSHIYIELLFVVIVIFIGAFYSDIVYYSSHISCIKIEFNYQPSRNWFLR